MPSPKAESPTYSVRAVVRLTGISEHVLRAWERRHSAVAPQRTPGGTRRYAPEDVARLRLLRAAVDAGHAIGAIARRSDGELRRLVAETPPIENTPMAEMFAALERLDAPRLEYLLATQFAALGPRTFAREIAQPLLAEVGRRWEAGDLSIAAEHMASATTRSVLGSALRPGRDGPGRSPLLFATPPGERHEFGLLIAALLAVSAGANVVFLGTDLPVDEIASAAETTGAHVVVVGISSLPPEDARTAVSALRDAVPPGVELWIGGAACASIPARSGLVVYDDLDTFEACVATTTVTAEAHA